MVNVMVKRRGILITSCGDERDECKRTAEDASKTSQMASKPGWSPCSGKSMAETYVLVMRCPVYRQRESHLGFRTELENLAGDGKGKGASGQTREAESTDASVRGGLLRISVEASNARGAKGAGHQRRDQ